MAVAYLDPGSGSLIASALVGGAAAAGVAVKSARARFTGVFSRKSKSDAGGDQAEATEVEGEGDEAEKAGTKASGESAEAPVAADAAARSDA